MTILKNQPFENASPMVNFYLYSHVSFLRLSVIFQELPTFFWGWTVVGPVEVIKWSSPPIEDVKGIQAPGKGIHEKTLHKTSIIPLMFGLFEPMIFETFEQKKNYYFPLNPGCLIGIRIMGYYNPHITGQYNPLYTLNNPVFFIAHLGSRYIYSLI